MNKAQYADLQNMKTESVLINVNDLDIQEGTLTYGYTCDRDTVHVYVKNGEIHYVQYSSNSMALKRHVHGTSLAAEILKPEKRSYPEATLFSFAALMAKAGTPLSMTSWSAAGERSMIDDTVWEPKALVV